MSQELLDKDSYFKNKQGTIFFYSKGTAFSEYRDLIPITLEEIEIEKQVQEEISKLLYQDSLFKTSQLNKSIIYNDKEFQSDTQSLNSLIAAQVSQIEPIIWFSKSNEPIELSQQDITNIIKEISQRNSQIINDKQTRIKELKECKTLNDLEQWKDKYKDTLPFLETENQF